MQSAGKQLRGTDHEEWYSAAQQTVKALHAYAVARFGPDAVRLALATPGRLPRIGTAGSPAKDAEMAEKEQVQWMWQAMKTMAWPNPRGPPTGSASEDTPRDDAGLKKELAWLKSWLPGSAPIRVDSATTIPNPARWKALALALAAEGPRGQVRRALAGRIGRVRAAVEGGEQP